MVAANNHRKYDFLTFHRLTGESEIVNYYIMELIMFKCEKIISPELLNYIQQFYNVRNMTFSDLYVRCLFKSNII